MIFSGKVSKRIVYSELNVRYIVCVFEILNSFIWNIYFYLTERGGNMPKVKVNDLEMFYVESGQGEPLVLIHDLGGDHKEMQVPVFFTEV